MGYCRRRYGTREMRLKTSGKNQYLCHPVNPIIASPGRANLYTPFEGFAQRQSSSRNLGGSAGAKRPVNHLCRCRKLHKGKA